MKLATTLIFILGAALFAQQIPIPRIEQMPNLPQPYQMRDWQQVAHAFDSLAFNLNAAGQHLPVIFLNSSTVNYPEHASFGIHSYVGTTTPAVGEAITALPAVIGATLAGIDKSNQNGQNWVLMCEEYFNRRPEENIYLNLPVTQSGVDWWYETMPNVFFYQLYDLYPGTGDFAYQFTTVANQWLRAVVAMGGSATPWQVPFMDYRAWSFSTMTPLNSGVREPEAAGAIAWILYHAYRETGEERYRIGAEWAMEFLNGRTTNPSYELQLPYGAYIAAKMNAQLGTNYDVEKLVNWCFEVGPLRNWGAIVGTWGGYDVSGLIGEVSGNDYAFLMNGIEQAGALVPLCRYDDRFTRAIGKWVLNLANASRMFYPGFLPPENQDSEGWAALHDPSRAIGHEAMRENQHGRSPFATGDAIAGGWAATNLALYGSAHVGILGGLIDTTNVTGILKIDMRKTDFFREAAYPTYLFYNPHPTTQSVIVDVGEGMHDLYDAVSNSFLVTGASGEVSINIAADAAVQLVIAPAGGAVSYHLDTMRIDGVTVDYRSANPVVNHPPRIKALAVRAETLFVNESATIYCTAEDRDGDALSFAWSADGGQISGNGAAVSWQAPGIAGVFRVTAVVRDTFGLADSALVTITVSDNRAPQISAISADPAIIDPGGSTVLLCQATDPDGDPLSYTWFAPAGSIHGEGASVNWTAPLSPGYYMIRCTVRDSGGAAVSDSVGVTAGRLVGEYLFNGDASDASGFGNHGQVTGATPTTDRFGNPNSAYFFDGVDDAIQVPLHPSLNFQEAITVTFWMKKAGFTGQEEFAVSHGSWQNRWKVSVIPNRKLRWTVYTETGIFDLDAPQPLADDSLYFVAVRYGAGVAKVYLNAVEVASANWSGPIRQTNLNLTIGQMLPGNTQYNFRGILDDVRIYNRALEAGEIQALFTLTSISGAGDSGHPTQTRLFPNYPNPFNGNTVIPYQIARSGRVKLSIFNLLGQEIRVLINQFQTAGYYAIMWDGTDQRGNSAASGLYLYRLKTDHFSRGGRLLLLK